jgi:glycine C-acetyltransferase
MYGTFKEFAENTLTEIKESGLYKNERIIQGPQGNLIQIAGGKRVINFCANNYLGLAAHPDILASAKKSLDEWGYGLSSVRFICGTQDIHKRLEERLTGFLGTEDTILYSSCFDANGGLFETLLGPEDAVISDKLNHASIIDGIRLCKAQRYLYSPSDMDALEARLEEASGARFRMIATDGVFSMDGTIAKLDKICDLAEKHDALVMVDDSHAVGVLGARGKGTHEYRDVVGRIDIITGTLGKALGGASGGYTSARKEIVDLLRQRSRPYLFSNTLSPTITSASITAIDLLEADTGLRDKLEENTGYFRNKLREQGFDIPEGDHPIIPIMLGDAVTAGKMADILLQEGIYVIGFWYPVVPKGTARIRVQISAVHSRDDLDYAVEKFAEARDKTTA